MTLPLSRRSLLGKIVAASAATMVLPARAHNGVDHTLEVQIKSFAFAPANLEVRVGDIVTFSNLDVAPHTATAVDKSWDTGTLKKGESATIEIVDGMEMSYICRFHPKMTGTLTLARG